MVKKLVRHGNSWALILDKPVLELLKITPGTPLRLETSGRALVVSPAGRRTRAGSFRKAVQFVLKQHGRTLRRLAE